MRFLPHAHRISLLSPAPVSHIFHSCRPSMPRKQKAALVPTPIKQSHKAMAFSYRPQTLHDTIHTVLPGEVLPAIPSYSEFIAVRLFVFQLTASRRGWHRISDILNFSTVISTNSLTKRLTNIGVTTSQQMIHFNSQPHEEADSSTVYMFSADSVFQLTASRRGWRRVYLCQVCSITYFNSQPHEEADKVSLYFDQSKSISTHSLTKRLTYLQMEQLVFRYISTHSLTKRLTEDRYCTNFHHNISTHSLTKRLTDNVSIANNVSIFQLTASRRGWPGAVHAVRKLHTFQLTASRRGWRF